MVGHNVGPKRKASAQEDGPPRRVTIIQQIGRVISDLRGKGDMAIILVEQYFDFAYGLADRFYVLKRGAVALQGTKAELSQETLRATVSV